MEVYPRLENVMERSILMVRRLKRMSHMGNSSGRICRRPEKMKCSLSLSDPRHRNGGGVVALAGLDGGFLHLAPDELR